MRPGLADCLRNVARLVAGQREPLALLERACAILAQPWEHAVVCAVTAPQPPDVVAVAGEPAAALALKNAVLAGKAPDCLKQALNGALAQQVFLEEDCHGCHATAGGAPSSTGIALPLKCHDALLGAVVVCIPGTVDLTGEPTELLLDISDLLGRALHAMAQAERSRERAEETLRAFAENIPVSVAMFDRDMNFLAVSRKFGQDANVPISALEGQNIFAAFPGLEDKWLDVQRRCLAGEVQGSEETRVMGPGGQPRWSRWAAHPWRTPTGEVGGAVAFFEDITQKKETELAAAKTQQQLTSLLDSLDDLVFGLELDGRFTDVHAPAVSALMMPPQAFLGKPFDEVLPPDLSAALKATMQQVRDGGQARLLDYQLEAGAWWSAKVSMRRNQDGQAVGYTVLSRNITDRKAAEQQVLEREAETRALFDLAPIGIGQADPVTGRMLRVNRQFCAITGYTAEQLVGMTVEELTHPDDRAVDATLRERLLRGEHEAYQREKRYVRRDGSVVWVSVNVLLLRDQQGTAQRLVATIEDITQRRSAESQSRLLMSALRAAGLGIVITDTTGVIDWVNPAFAELTGYTRDELIGKHTRTLQSGVHPKEFYTQMWDTILKGQVWHGELMNRRKDGTIYPEDAAITPVLDDQGVLTHFVGVKRDATLRRQAQDALRASEERYRLLLDNLDDVIYTADTQNRIVLVNKAVSRFGYQPEDVLGRSVEEFVVPEDLARLREKTEARPGTRGTRELRILDAKGNPRAVRVTTRAIRVAGKVVGATTVLVDLTQQREVEEQLRAAQRMEAVGRLAGGVAHDFNNLLSVILSFTELATMDLHKDDPLREDLGQVLGAARRAESLTRQLLAFSRRQVLQPAVFNLNDLVDAIFRMLERLIGEDIELVLQLQENLALVKADKGQLEQVIMNLVVNARDAMDQGGKVVVATQDVELNAASAAPMGLGPGWYVAMTVTDTGSGMDRATQERMFEPFFTTKELGKGTGLGLSMVYGIIKQSDGGIQVESELGKGTRFTVYLPRVDSGVRPSPAAVPSMVRAVQSETVLVVEDEPALRNVARRILVAAGYQVLVAANGGEALLLCEKDGGSINLILTDVVMPGMSGMELTRRLAPLCPKARVLFTSGYTHDAIAQHGLMEGEFLPKPYDAQLLAAKVRQVLDQA